MSRVGARLGDELELRALGRAIWHRRWRILAPAFILSVLAFLAVNAITPLYRSEARILIEGRDNIYLRPEAEKTAERNIIDPEAVASQVQVILSKDLALRVIRQLKLGERPEFDPVLNGVSTSSMVLKEPQSTSRSDSPAPSSATWIQSSVAVSSSPKGESY